MSQEERPLVKGQVPVDFLVLRDQLHEDHPPHMGLWDLSLCSLVVGECLSSAWMAFWWSPDMPMDDARHGVESSTETPEGGGAPMPCQSK